MHQRFSAETTFLSRCLAHFWRSPSGVPKALRLNQNGCSLKRTSHQLLFVSIRPRLSLSLTPYTMIFRTFCTEQARKTLLGGGAGGGPSFMAMLLALLAAQQESLLLQVLLQRNVHGRFAKTTKTKTTSAPGRELAHFDSRANCWKFRARFANSVHTLSPPAHRFSELSNPNSESPRVSCPLGCKRECPHSAQCTVPAVAKAHP